MPPLEVGAGLGPSRHTSFPFDAASKLDAAAGLHPNRSGSLNSGLNPGGHGHLQDSHSASAGELSAGGGVPVLPQGGPLPVPGTSPARRAAAVRQHFGMPPPGRRSSPGARRSSFADERGG